MQRYDNIPAELKALPQWVCRKGKMPYTPTTGTLAKAGTPATWATFEQAATARGYDGIGFEFATGGQYIGIDLDTVRNPESGYIAPEALEIIHDLDSYTEISPSGYGFHIICRMDDPVTVEILKHKAPLPENEIVRLDGKGKPKKPEIEVYKDKRYFTMTGDVYDGRSQIKEQSAMVKAIMLAWLPKEHQEERPDSGAYPQGCDFHTDEEWFRRGLEKDQKFNAYYNGARYFSDESRNDQAFMNKLAYWCNCNLDLMLRAFRESPYCGYKDDVHKAKALNRTDYLPRTAKEAIAGCSTTAQEDHEQYRRERVQNDFGEAPPAVEQEELEIISSSALQDKWIAPLIFLVDRFLTPGLAMLASPPKYGKSWFVLDLCLSIAQGKPFLGYDTNKGTCLYLALEDTERRLKDRMNKVLQGAKAPDNFFFATKAKTIEDGLLHQLEAHMKKYPDTKLIVIDTLQKVRQAGSGKDVYGRDYRDMGALKAFADKHGICILLVHHLRKMQSFGDPFDRISGTTGISGAADTAMVMEREKRSDADTMFSYTSRDVGEQEIVLRFNKETFRWENAGTADWLREQREILDFNNNPIVQTIRGLLNESETHEWKGTSTDLIEAGKRLLDDVIADSPTKLGKQLNGMDSMLLRHGGIIHSYMKNGSGSGNHSFHYQRKY